ncbi:hypothetical protein LRR81_06225 [Metabacillus sp. GX 13764]|uniref:hypothetical protein n=1 Tax=Metabacillus kandeliae TaxID=2900151 RepID=UPI001E34B287|nr:hypothetical protein [Metabacillus kandeliae]MCD7033825.1 hypothetical protein [Metabacillus kandeliae]
MYSEKQRKDIEEAILSAISLSDDQTEIGQLAELLNRFKSENAGADGFRYDYDDSSSGQG